MKVISIILILLLPLSLLSQNNMPTKVDWEYLFHTANHPFLDCNEEKQIPYIGIGDTIQITYHLDGCSGRFQSILRAIKINENRFLLSYIDLSKKTILNLHTDSTLIYDIFLLETECKIKQGTKQCSYLEHFFFDFNGYCSTYEISICGWNMFYYIIEKMNKEIEFIEAQKIDTIQSFLFEQRKIDVIPKNTFLKEISSKERFTPSLYQIEKCEKIISSNDKLNSAKYMVQPPLNRTKSVKKIRDIF